MATTEPIPARGFGHGLPAQGGDVALTLHGGELWIDDWPGVRAVRQADLSVRRQGDGLLLEWDGEAGRCALLLSPAAAVHLAGWLPAIQRAGHDGATRRWLWGSLAVVLGLPLLLLALFFAFRVEIVDALVARIPVAQEQALGDELWQLQSARLNLIEGSRANRFLDATGARLIAAKASPYSYRFHLADEPVVNAFAMPGGHIVVYRGLIEHAGSAEEVAGVLAHEIEHVERRHSLRGMAQSLGLSLVLATLGGDLSGSVAASWLADLAGLQFSRRQENEADAGGFDRLVAAGIDPSGMATFFERLAQEQGTMPGALAMLSTHPDSAERAVAIRLRTTAAAKQPPMQVDWNQIQDVP